jgi:AcrR family transcriptional regulator
MESHGGVAQPGAPEEAPVSDGSHVPAPRRRGPYRTGLQRRAQLIHHATDVFATRGLAGGSLREIADRVDVTPASILRHFTGKEDLLVAVLQHWDEHQIRNEQQADGLAFFESLRGITRFNMEHPGLLQLYITLGMEAVDPQHPAHPYVTARQVRTLDSFARNLRHGIADGDFAPLDEDTIAVEARLLMALLDGLALQWLLTPGMDLVEAIGTALDTTLSRWRRTPGFPAGGRAAGHAR